MFPSFSTHLICSFHVLSLLFMTRHSCSASRSAQLSIYDVLRSHGLPIGLLPKGVKEFSLFENGRFEVHLDQACNAKFENEVHYDRNVSGALSYGRMEDISGLSAQDLFLWLPVKGIRVDIPSSGLIYFDVGLVYKQFSLSLFESPPDCKAADHVDTPDHLLQEGRTVAETISKSQSQKLGYELDQEEELQRMDQ